MIIKEYQHLFVLSLFQLIRSIYKFTEAPYSLYLVQIVISAFELLMIFNLIYRKSREDIAIMSIISLNIVLSSIENILLHSFPLSITIFEYALLLQQGSKYKNSHTFINYSTTLFCAITYFFYSNPLDAFNYLVVLLLHNLLTYTPPTNNNITSSPRFRSIFTPFDLASVAKLSDLSPLSSNRNEESCIDYRSIMSIIGEGVAVVELSNDLSSSRLIFQNLANREIYGVGDCELLTHLDQIDCQKDMEFTMNLPKNSYVSSGGSVYIRKSQRNRKMYEPLQSNNITMNNNNNNNNNRPSILQMARALWQEKRFKVDTQMSYESIKVESQVVVNQQKKYLETLIIVLSVTKVMLFTKEIKDRGQVRQLMEQNRSKSKTLAYVSHELRTPLSAIICSLQSIQNQSTEVQEQIQISLECSFHMLSISNDLLDLAQIKADAFKLRLNFFDVVALAQECLNMFTLQAAKKGIELKVFKSQDSIVLYSDRSRLKQIIVNLIGNSLKFTKNGTIEVRLIQNCGLVEVGVADTGLGISEENQQNLFRAFSKIENDDNRELNSQGIGLGLVISNKLAKLISINNNALQVRSQANQGSYFYLTIQVAQCSHKKPSIQQVSRKVLKDEESENVRQTAQTLRCQDECFHILIADDNVFNQQMLALIVKKLCHDVDFASDGKEAVEMAQSKQCSKGCRGYKYIFMDIEMPIMDGLKAAQLIKSKNSYAKLYILSGHNDEEMKTLCRKMDVEGYLVKPIDFSLMKQILC